MVSLDKNKKDKEIDNKGEITPKEKIASKVFEISNPDQLIHIQNWISKIAEVTDGKPGAFSYIFKENYDTNNMEVFVHSEKINFTKKLA